MTTPITQAELDDWRRLFGHQGSIYLPTVGRLIDEVERLRAQLAWQPIETATDQDAFPWDGAPVIIATNHRFGRGRVHRAFWTDEIHGHGIFGWAVEDCKFGPYPLRGYTVVSHYMRPPDPPETE